MGLQLPAVDERSDEEDSIDLGIEPALVRKDGDAVIKNKSIIRCVGVDPNQGSKDYLMGEDDDSTGSAFSSSSDLNRTRNDDVDESNHSQTTTTSAVQRRRGIFFLGFRRLTIVMFFSLAIIMPASVYLVIRNSEQSSFANEFQSLSEQVVEEFENNLGIKFVGSDIMSITATSSALDSNSSWPFVTIPDFDLLAKSVLALTQTPILVLLPLVPDALRSEWEAYSVENIDWLRQGIEREKGIHQRQERRRTNKLFYSESQEAEEQPRPSSLRNLQEGPVLPDLSEGYPKQIWKFDATSQIGLAIEDKYDDYLVTWQAVPLQALSVNYNTFGVLSQVEAVQETISSAQAVFSRVRNFTEDYIPSVLEYLQEVYSGYLQTLSGDVNATWVDEPISNLYYPIFDSWDLQERKVVGIYTMTIFWEMFFRRTLPPNSNAVICVVENTCGDVYTFEIHGDETTFLGYEDFHSERYEDDAVTYDFSWDKKSAKFKFSSTAVGLNEDFCLSTLRVYPTSQMEDAHTSLEPWLVGAGVVFFFLMVAIVTASYDFVVRRRIHRVAKTERDAQAIVAQHFPTLVVDRMLAQNTKDGRQQRGLSRSKFKRHTSKTMFHPKALLKSYIDKDQKDDLAFLTEAPVADLFLQCTVLFADICGFSAWSSEREPSQIFTLLETIFQAFDKLAKKHGVFKVETIGDSYVAVTGLPEPQADHAVRMTRFAKDGLSRANEVTRVLVTTLGPDTEDLRFRFGLNSGAVTAGVLRGEKARFQLFGDTVNTASRMESSGQGNRIHLSSTTADMLILAGLEVWVQLRNDSVDVKGKGIIKTYWAINHESDMLTLNSSRGRLSRSQYLGLVMDEPYDSKETAFTNEKDLWGEEGRSIFNLPSLSKVSKAERLVDWLTEIMTLHLKRLMAQRKTRILLVRAMSVAMSSATTAITGPLKTLNSAANSATTAMSTPLKTLNSAASSATVAMSTPLKTLNSAASSATTAITGPLKTLNLAASSATTAMSTPLKTLNSAASSASTAMSTPLKTLNSAASSATTAITNPLKTLTSAASAALQSKSLADAIEKKDAVIDEVVEAFIMPKFDPKKVSATQIDPESIDLSPEVISQLRGFITAISATYRENPFHSFEHASHVTMSAVKLLNRIVVPEDIDYTRVSVDDINSDLHDYTFGITSDELAQFAVAFSTLIHDVDHRGVPNGQLAAEVPEMGDKYKHRSVAEQHSVDLAWEMLMDPKYKDLQGCIFTNEKEITRFRHYVVNLVMATDIFEKEMKQLRDQRWEKAFFHEGDGLTDDSASVSSGVSAMRTVQDEAANLKATIVLEHIIQAADVSHTMQHWNIYKKWNERLFQEMYAAYESGRAEKDPSASWYGGELWFFDNYVIPLAKKLEQCGVFGVSSDECLNYAMANREEWETKGKDVVVEMVERHHKKKELEVGGFTTEEINSFSSKELEYLLQRLIKKGRAFGSFKGTDLHGQRNAARSWLDALEMHERCPASHSMKDPTLIFPVFSGVLAFIKGGKIMQEADYCFEIKLAETFVRDSRRLGDPTHYMRALAALCEVRYRSGKVQDALDLFEKEIKSIYDPKKHTAAIAKVYGTDRVSHAFSQAAMWYYELGDIEKSNAMIDHVLTVLLPSMEPDNILNSCTLLYPIIRLVAFREGENNNRKMRNLFEKQVVSNFHFYEIKLTPCRVLFKPLRMLLDMRHDPDIYPDYAEAVVWLLERDNVIMSDFFDSIFTKIGWSPNDMNAELCLRAAKHLHSQLKEGDDDDDDDDADKSNKDPMAAIHTLVGNGIAAARKGEEKMKYDNGKVRFAVAYEIHVSLFEELMEFAKQVRLQVELEPLASYSTKPDRPLETSMGVVWLNTAA